MNIGITVYPTYGGSGIVGSELGKELAARGHTVHFIASSLPTRLTELSARVRFHEVEMMSYPLFEHQPYTLALATKMGRSRRRKNSTCCMSITRFRTRSARFWRANH